jgi:hypothetical protein
VDVQELVTRPLPAGEGEEALTFFKGGREELVLQLGKISSLWELKIKPLKILLMLNKMSSLHSVKKMSPISALPRLQHWLDMINSNVLVKVQNSLNFIILNMTLKEILSKSDKLKETCTLDLKIFSHPILFGPPLYIIKNFVSLRAILSVRCRAILGTLTGTLTCYGGSVRMILGCVVTGLSSATLLRKPLLNS